MPNASLGNELEVDGLRIQLRQRGIAAFLAWLIPGAGHYYQGRQGKAALYASTVLTLFVIGMVLSKGHAVYWSWTPQDWRIHYFCQVGVGLPAMPALAQSYLDPKGTKRLQNKWWPSWMASPINTNELDDWHLETSSGFDLGTLYTMIAGLLNFLIVFDAYGGPLPMPGNEQRQKVKDPQTPPTDS